MREQAIRTRAVLVGNTTLGPMLGCCADCSLFHSSKHAATVCQRFIRARNTPDEPPAWRALVRAVAEHH